MTALHSNRIPSQRNKSFSVVGDFKGQTFYWLLLKVQHSSCPAVINWATLGGGATLATGAGPHGAGPRCSWRGVIRGHCVFGCRFPLKAAVMVAGVSERPRPSWPDGGFAHVTAVISPVMRGRAQVECFSFPACARSQHADFLIFLMCRSPASVWPLRICCLICFAFYHNWPLQKACLCVSLCIPQVDTL